MGGGGLTRVTARAGRRTAAEWLPRVYGYDSLTSLGEMGRLTVRTLRLVVTPPFPWWRDAVVEFSLAFRRCLIPLVLSMVVFATGIAVLFVGQIVATLGTSDRLIGALTIGWIREPAIWVSSMIFAGVAGSAMTADIGARRIREELDALEVLGVETTRSLVVPRVVAMVAIAPVLGLVTLFVAEGVTYLLVPIFYPSVTYGGQMETIRAFLFTVDLVMLLVKLPLVGLFVGVVACHKGLTTKGGAEGVGRSVNQAVVIMFLGLWLLNSLVNTGYLALFPSVQELRG
jgi:phospholipid/cholesterol/gamma-HCH transport system permease protein